ncbi:MAG: acyl-CoA thioesterase [Bacteroidales bacterium]|nr:acyl-CoA thioesterase [Bacteroidales bacterium]
MTVPNFELELEVRDYELDFQGIVNNAVYLNYLEYARHKYLDTRGLNFVQLHQQGVDLVVSRNEIDYKSSLRAGDRFVVCVSTERVGHVRLVFHQQILRLPERTLCIKAKVTGVALRNGRPMPINELPAI